MPVCSSPTMEDGGSKIAILYPQSSILDCSAPSGLMILDDVLGQAPAQNFRRAFGDTDAAHLAIPPLERQLAHQPQATVHLNRAVDHPTGHFGAHDFGHVGKLPHVFTAVVPPGALVNH